MSVDPEATPTDGNSADPTATPEQVNWEQRFKDTQAAFTQSQQELAALKKLANGEDPEALKAVLDKYGYELADDEDEEPDLEDPNVYDDGTTNDDPRLAQFEQFMQAQMEREEQQLREAEWTGWQNFVTEKAKEQGVTFKPRDIKAMMADSLGDNGLPVPPDQAEKILAAYLQELQDEQPQRRPRAPHVPTGGTAGDGPVDTSEMSPSELTRFMTDRLNAETA